jgi:hypothetical protein
MVDRALLTAALVQHGVVPTGSSSIIGWRFAAWLSIIAFGLHFTWEVLQCSIFFVHGSFDATMWGMGRATLIDVCLTWIIYGTVVAISRDLNWVASGWSVWQWIGMTLSAALTGVIVEQRALESGSWSYTDWAPILPVVGVSAVPVLQLMLLTPISFLIARAAVWRS